MVPRGCQLHGQGCPRHQRRWSEGAAAMSAAEQRDMEDGTAADPDSGLGATADPVAFGAALAASASGSRSAHARRGLDGQVRGGARRGRRRCRHARSLGSSTEGPVSTAEPDARFSDPTWESSPGFYGLRQCYLLWGRTMRGARCRCERRTTSSDERRSSPSGRWSTRSRRPTSCSATRRR